MALYLNGNKIIDGRFQAGTAVAPSISFTGATGTGGYSYGVNSFGIATGGVARLALNSVSLYVDSVTTLTATTLTLKGTIADGASAVGTILDNSVSFVTAGAKIASFRNATVEKAYISKDGILGTGTLIANAAGTVAILNDSADVAEANSGWLEIQAVNGTRYRVPVWAI